MKFILVVKNAEDITWLAGSLAEANRAANDGCITVDNLEPNPKNPIIVAFFRNIGYADQFGSGVRNLFKYSKYYCGQKLQFIEGDVFRIIVPLDDDYSFDFGQHEHVNQSDQLIQTDLSEDEIILLNLIKEHPDMTNSLLAETLGWSVSRVKYYILFDALFGNKNQIPTVTSILPAAAKNEIMSGRLPILNTDQLFLKRGEKVLKK